MRDLPINRITGNMVDEVAAAYARYRRETADGLDFQHWHDSKLCPAHGLCSACSR